MKSVQAILAVGIALFAVAIGALAHHSYAMWLDGMPGSELASVDFDSLCLGAGQQTIDRQSRDQRSRK